MNILVKKNNKEKKIDDYILQSFPIILGIGIIMGICLSHLNSNVAIKIIGDEYGYWAAGSWFAGYNWSEMTGITGYYGYGIGIIYALILRFTTDQVIAYKCAIVINALFICLMFIIAYKVIDLVDKEHDVPRFIKLIMALVSNLYVSNILYSQQSICENFLTLIIWINFLSLILYARTSKVKYEIIAIVAAAFSVAVHLRSIGSAAVFIMLISILNYKKNHSFKREIVFFLIVFILLCVVFWIKKSYQNSMVVNAISFDGNDFSGMSWRLWFFSTPEGMIDFIHGLLGKLFYAVLSTYGLGVVTVIVGGRWLIGKNKSWLGEISLFITLVFASELLIDNFFISTGTRFDGYMYSRYFSQTIPQMIMMGMVSIYVYRDKVSKYIIYVSLVFVFLAKFVENNINYSFPKNAVYGSNPFIYKFLDEKRYAYGSIVRCALYVICAFFIAYMVITMTKVCKWQKYVWIILFCLMAVTWVDQAYYAYDKGLFYGKTEPIMEMELADYIKEKNIQDKLVFYAMSFPSADTLQYLLKDSTIHVAVEEDKVNEYLQKGYYLLTPSREKIDFVQEEKYHLLYTSSWLNLWEVSE